jgi:hypothetical protein
VYPTPGFVILIEDILWEVLIIDDVAVAVTPEPTFPTIVTIGAVEYPTPLSVRFIEMTPDCEVSIPQVAAAPTPLPVIVMIGVEV